MHWAVYDTMWAIGCIGEALYRDRSIHRYIDVEQHESYCRDLAPDSEFGTVLLSSENDRQ